MTRPWIPPRPRLWVGREHLHLRDTLGRSHVRRFADLATLRTGCIELASELPRWRGVEVVVSDAYCRYLVLPRIAGTRNRAELEAGMAARFASSFGDDPADWLLQHDGAPLDGPDLVCALQRASAEAIIAGLAAARRHVRHLQPLWIWCSQHRLGAARAPHWLASSDGDMLTLGLFHRQRCVGIRSTRLGDAPLSAALARETARQDAHEAGTPIWWFGSAQAPARLADSSPIVAAGLAMPFTEGGAL